MEHSSSHEHPYSHDHQPLEHSGQHSEHLKPEVDEFFRQEGLTEEHWQRIYDLRYCSILVPLLDDTGKKKHARQDPHSPKRKASPPTDTDTSQLPTPTTTPRAIVSRPHVSPRPTVAPPIKYLPKDPQDGEDGQDEQDEQARPLKKRMIDVDHAWGDVMEDGDDDGNMSEDSFHDALDTTTEAVPSQQQQHIRSLRLDPVHISSTPSFTAGVKRHWEVTTPAPLILQQRTPLSHEPRKIAIPSTFKHPSEAVSLLRPRSIESAPVTHFNRIPVREGTAGSISSRSSRSSWASADAKWTDQNWKELEALYVAMEGDMLTEEELGAIAERFLAEYKIRTGEAPWSKVAMRDRCQALYRVGGSQVTPQSITTWRSNIGRDPPKSSIVMDPPVSLTPYTPLLTQRKFQGPTTSSHRSYNRSSASPYPSHHLRRNWTPQRSVSPAPSQSSMASSSSFSFVNQQRTHRNHRSRMDEDRQPGHQIKSVFKKKVAMGLKTVGQLIPFWKDVEDGETNIKEEVAVSLVKAPKVQSMIESFEFLDDSSSSMIKQEEETMSRRSSLLSSSGSVRSVAEMIAQGHARRVSETKMQ
ncbi:hypothetical protein MVEG_05100 [Podila verticillata NRRL 6337]|nr:hypothetical protein MVEG_05100 [Podila verticillata NRRL 6337]